MSDRDSDFEKCITRSEGGKAIDCRLGLWGISSYSPESAEREARRFWIPLFHKGKYDDFLKSPTNY